MANHDMEDVGSDTAMHAVQQEEKCPMSCCMQASSSSAARPVLAAASSALLLQSVTFILSESQVFTAAGFSSHTDRGPPSISH
jgi:hypothetical protein